MYNAFAANKKTNELALIQKKTQSNIKYIKKYYNITRPNLIDSHNKRINSFIRRMEQQPIQLHLDPNLKHSSTLINQNSRIKINRRSNSLNTGRKDYSSNEQQVYVQQGFRFKNIQDWKSLFTPFERLQRQRNYHIFKEKYGDPAIAFRSIGSQSQYKTGHEFRQRDKSSEINPPMRYTNKPTKQVLAKLKSKYSKKKHSKAIDSNFINESKQQQGLLRRNTGSSLSGLNQDNILISDNNTEKASRQDQQAHRQFDYENKQKDKKKHLKMHFKQIMDLQQNISDVKTRKALRQILYRCGIYKKKNRRAATDSQVDQLSQFTDGHSRDH